MSLSPRSRRLRGDRLIPSTEGKQFALFPDWNHVVFVLLHRTVTRGMRQNIGHFLPREDRENYRMAAIGDLTNHMC